MTRALVTQLVEALDAMYSEGLRLGWHAHPHWSTGMSNTNAAITAAREYLATEPSGERAEFEAWCKSVGHSTSLDHADKRRYWYAETSAAWDAWQASRKAKQAYDMLEADASLRTQLALLTVEKDMVIGLLADLLEADAQQAKKKDAELIAVYAKLAEAELRANKAEAQHKSQCRITESALNELTQQAKRVPMTCQEADAAWSRYVSDEFFTHEDLIRLVEAHHDIHAPK